MIRTLAIALFSICITPAFAQNEVMYHVSTRSFFDSNGDGQGDLKGIMDKLEYLQQLGVTSVSLSPIYQSDFYHNLYASNFEKVDAGYGAFKEYRDLVQNIHQRKMKVYQELDLQYVSAKHLWYTNSFKNTKSAYSGYIYYTDVKNEKPYLLPEITTYKGVKEQVAAVNLKNAKVLDYFTKTLTYWADPNGDGNFSDGVDGFRFVDVKDKLDNSGKTGNQLKTFYAPLIANLKKINPVLQIIAKSSDNTVSGNLFYTKGNFDRVLSSQLQGAIVSFDKKKIVTAADSIFAKQADGKVPVIYIEDESTRRTASLPGMNAGRLRVAAGLNFLLGGVPCIYYGQEIGMMGKPMSTETDGDGIASREAFDWYASGEGTGMAEWYKDGGVYWDNRSIKAADGVSVEEQQKKDSNSLWDYYKQLVRMKKMQQAIRLGKYEKITNSNPNVVSFSRVHEGNRVLVMINLSDKPEQVRVDEKNTIRLDNLKLLFGTPNASFVKGGREVTLTPYCVQVWQCIY